MGKIQDFKKYARKYQPALTIERYMGDFGNGLFSFFIFGSTTVFGFLSVISLAAISFSGNDGYFGLFAKSAVSDFGEYSRYIYGLFFIFFSIELMVRLIKAFHDSYAFSDLTIEEDDNLPAVTYEAAPIILDSPETDIVEAFLNTSAGTSIFGRLGLRENDVRNFIKNRIKPVSIRDLLVKNSDSQAINLLILAKIIITIDHDFLVFLTSGKITGEDFTGATAWVEYISREIRFERRWWGRYKLGRIRGIGKNWSFG